jgi:hypothetical protein
MDRNSIGKNIEIIPGVLFIFYMIARVFIRFEPLNNFPNSDSSVYLYIGRGILKGQIPYLDIWDHKGPLLYYINALGLWLLGLWGVWILEFILLFFGFCAAFLSARKLLGVIPSFIGISTGYYLLHLYSSGNTTEEYSIAFALLTFGLYYFYSQNPTQRLPLLGIGFLFMCTFLMRPNNIGFQSAIILSVGIADMLQKNLKHLSAKICWIGLGALILLAPFLLFFGSNQALDPFYDQVFRYNFIYIENSNADINFYKLFFPPLLYVLFAALATYGVVLLEGKKHIMSNQLQENKIILILFLALPLEFFLSQLSGRRYDHYYLTWLPYLMFASAFSASRIFRPFLSLEKVNRPFLFFIIIAGFIVWPPFQMLRGYADIRRSIIHDHANGIEKKNSLIDFIHDNTDPQDKVLRWGYGRWLTYGIDRETPGRFVYQLALTMPGYTTDEMVNEFAWDLELEKPKFIIEAINYFIPLSSNELPSYHGYFPPGFIDIVNFIRKNYHVVKISTDPDGWREGGERIKLWELNNPEENAP